jgi:hypothetical protein
MEHTIKYIFTHDDHPKAELSFWVEYDGDYDESALNNRAYGLLQEVHPVSWHDWRLLESFEI